MKRFQVLFGALFLAAFLILPTTAFADSVLYNNDVPQNMMASASTPRGNGFIEHESADDFLLTTGASITSATFTGLVPAGATVQQVIVEMYQVFPLDSTNPPSNRVPTRLNSPSDVAFASRDSVAGELIFSTSVVSTSFTALNRVVNGINPSPNQTTGGEGPVTGQEVRFTVNFVSPISLPADHYFFVPQVLLGNSTTPFLWLSAPRPLILTPFVPDLQSWIRDANLDPDWLRIGTDIVGGAPAPTFNAAFSISGVEVEPVPEPSSLILLALGGGVSLFGRAWKRKK